MDRTPESVGTGRTDALSRADALAERAATTRAIGQLTLDNARLTRERDALADQVADEQVARVRAIVATALREIQKLLKLDPLHGLITSVHTQMQAAIDAAAHRGTLTDPIPDAQFETAAAALAWLRRSAGHWLDVWPPLVAVSGEFVFELWHYPRKLTLYVESDGTVSVIRAWGDHADEMDEPPYDEATRDGLLRWLETGEEMPG